MSCATATVVQLEAVDAAALEARQLIDALCAELQERYGTPASPFSPEEARGPRGAFIVARVADKAVGCGAFRPLDHTTAEIKRMYVAPDGRRRGVARAVLRELERRALTIGYHTVRLETGIYQPEAIGLYESEGYQRIEPYGHHIGEEISVCYEKVLSPNEKRS